MLHISLQDCFHCVKGECGSFEKWVEEIVGEVVGAPTVEQRMELGGSKLEGIQYDASEVSTEETTIGDLFLVRSP